LVKEAIDVKHNGKVYQRNTLARSSED